MACLAEATANPRKLIFLQFCHFWLRGRIQSAGAARNPLWYLNLVLVTSAFAPLGLTGQFCPDVSSSTKIGSISTCFKAFPPSQ